MNVSQVCSLHALNRPALFERTNSSEQLDELFESSISRKGSLRPHEQQHNDHREGARHHQSRRLVSSRANNMAIRNNSESCAASLEKLVAVRPMKSSPDVEFSLKSTTKMSSLDKKNNSSSATPTKGESSKSKASRSKSSESSSRASLEPTLKQLKSAASRTQPLCPTSVVSAANFEPTLKHLKSAAARQLAPHDDGPTASVISPVSARNNSRVNSSIRSLPTLTPQAVKSKDSSVFSGKKAVFYRHLKGPVIRIQSLVRGMLARTQYRQLLLDKVQQERVNRQVKAATRIQTTARAWLGRLKFQITRLQHELHSITSAHELELHRIEVHKKREMEHCFRELNQQAVLEQVEQLTHCSGNKQIVKELRESNLHLRQDTQEMHEAVVELQKRNDKLELLTEFTQFNIKKLEKVIARLTKDVDMGHLIVAECSKRVDEYQAALAECEEFISYESHLGHSARRTIASLLEHVEAGCSDEELKNNIIGSTTADVETIRSNSKSCTSH